MVGGNLKKQDANGVRTATDIERKYKLQDIEKAEAQAKYAVSGLQAKLDTTEFEAVLGDLEDAIEQALQDIEDATEEALGDIEDAVETIQNSLENYVLISSELTEAEIEEILDEEEE